MSVWEVMSGNELYMNVCWKLENCFPLTRDVLFWRNITARSNNCTSLMNFGLRPCAMVSWS